MFFKRKKKQELPREGLCEFEYYCGVGMEVSSYYLVTADDDGVFLYTEKGAEQTHSDNARVGDCVPGELEALIEKHNIAAWDGFSRENKMIDNGDCFSLSVRYRQGAPITAYGYMAFPPDSTAAFAELELYLAELAGEDISGDEADADARSPREELEAMFGHVEDADESIYDEIDYDAPDDDENKAE